MRIVSTAKGMSKATAPRVFMLLPMSSASLLGRKTEMVRLRLDYSGVSSPKNECGVEKSESNDNEVPCKLQRLVGNPMLNGDFGKRRMKCHCIRL